MSAGYVYAMMNPSLSGLVKIGKTNREPIDRAKELSSTTGVPTPFVVVYEEFFHNCEAAEKMVHNILEENGYRVASNREFFEMSVSDAVKIIMKVKGNMSIEETDEYDIYEEDNDESQPWLSMYLRGKKLHYGYEEEFEDIEKAIWYYEKSIQLGGPLAHKQLGIIRRDEEGYYDYKNSKSHFMDGINNGDIDCYAEISILFLRKNERENFKKAWSSYFKNVRNIEDVHGDIIHYCLEYLFYCIISNFEIIHLDVLKEKSEKIKEELIDRIRVSTNQDITETYKEMLSFLDGTMKSLRVTCAHCNTLDQHSFLRSTDTVIDYRCVACGKVFFIRKSEAKITRVAEPETEQNPSIDQNPSTESTEQSPARLRWWPFTQK